MALGCSFAPRGGRRAKSVCWFAFTKVLPLCRLSHNKNLRTEFYLKCTLIYCTMLNAVQFFCALYFSECTTETIKMAKLLLQKVSKRILYVKECAFPLHMQRKKIRLCHFNSNIDHNMMHVSALHTLWKWHDEREKSEEEIWKWLQK